MIHMTKVSKGFQQGEKFIPVLKQMSVEIPTGEVLAVLGPSGSGKSTFLSLLGLLDSPDEGDLLFDGESTRTWSQNQRTQFRGKNLGIVFQQYHLVPYLTALENVSLPLIINKLKPLKDIQPLAIKLLNDVGLGHRIHHRPAQLSGGESQRVALARALIHEPKLLLADEPSGNLDQKTAESVMAVFFDLLKQTHTTAVLVTHDSELANRCHRQLHLKEGQLC